MSNKLVFKEVEIVNFMSFGQKPATLVLDRSETCLIMGENRDVGSEGESRNGVGKCLGKDTPILMYDGSIRMVQDVVVGDVLMGDDGTPRNVLSTTRGREELFRVRQNKGMDYVVNRSHILSLKVGTNRPKWGLVKGEVVNMDINRYLEMPEACKKSVCGYTADLIHLDHSDGSEYYIDPWLLGLWLADGSASRSAITFHNEDTELIDAVSVLADGYGWVTKIYPSSVRENCTTITYNGGMQSVLRVENLLDNKHIPDKYKFGSYNTRIEILSGVLDGDGYIHNGCYELTMKKSRLVDDIVFLARSLGFRVIEKDKFSKCDGFDGDIYRRLMISGDIGKLNLRLSRKRGNRENRTVNFGVTGISVESIGVGDYYGFEIDGNKLFCLGDLTVTHNTSIYNAITFSLFGRGIDKIKADEYINITNGKGLKVRTVFEKGSDVFEVTRTRKPNGLTLTKNGTSLTLDSMKNTEQSIVDILGFDYDVFVLLFYLAPDKASFMSMSGAEQRDIIEKLLSLDVLAERAAAVKEMVSERKGDLKLVQRDLDNAIDNKLKSERMLASLEQQQSEFERQKTEKISVFEQQIESCDFDYLDRQASIIHSNNSLIETVDDLKNKILSDRELLNEKTNEVREYQAIISEYDRLRKRADGYDESTNQEIEDLRKQVSEEPDLGDISDAIAAVEENERVESLIAEMNRERRDNERELVSTEQCVESLTSHIRSLESGVCRECGQSHFDQEKLAGLAGELVNTEEHLKTLHETKNRIETEISALRGQLDDQFDGFTVSSLRADYDRIDKLHQRLSALESKKDENPYRREIDDIDLVEIQNATVAMTEMATEIDSLHDRIDRMGSELDTAQTSIVPTDFSSIEAIEYEKKRIENLRVELDGIRAEQNPFDRSVEEQREAIPDVSGIEAERDVIEKEVTHLTYLQRLLTDNKSFIRKGIVDKYIPFVNKKIIEYSQYLDLPHIAQIGSDMSVDVTYLNKSVSYYNLSKGERLRLNIATTAAFRDLTAMLDKGCDLIMIDELFDGSLDSGGMKKAFHFVSGLTENMLLISHRDELTTEVDKKITIIKENAFARIEE